MYLLFFWTRCSRNYEVTTLYWNSHLLSDKNIIPSLESAFMLFLIENSSATSNFLTLVDPCDETNDLGMRLDFQLFLTQKGCTVYNYSEICRLFDNILKFVRGSHSERPLTEFLRGYMKGNVKDIGADCRENRNRQVLGQGEKNHRNSKGLTREESETSQRIR